MENTALLKSARLSTHDTKVKDSQLQSNFFSNY